MDVSLRLYKGIPTSHTIEPDGFFYLGAPFQSVPIEQTERLRQAIVAAIARGNPPISSDQARAFSDSKKSAMLAAAGARSWYVLDRLTNGLWSLVEINGVHQIRVDQPMQPRG